MNRHVKKIFSIFKYSKKEVENIIQNINRCKDREYIVMYNPECIGVMNSAKEIFENTIELKEQFHKKAIETIARAVVDSHIKQIIFSTMAYGYDALAEKIYNLNENIKVKFLWHGSHSLFVNDNEEYFLNSILDLQKRGIVTAIGFAKESMAKFYQMKGFNAYFVKNTVHIHHELPANRINQDEVKIGLYAAGDRWEKNTYNQLSACSLVSRKLVVDCIPATELTMNYCKLMNIKLSNESCNHSVSREELINKLSNNDVNLYATFTECSPLIPLESLECGVPCVIGDNTHYFKDTELEQYLVVKSEDNIDEIADKIKLCIENKSKIIDLYKNWKKTYDDQSKESVNQFLKG
ncbi:MAG: glycosyltransferase [Clostridia bacterium]|nr:glycosyltransferase [Clostridia bacterium]